jgi:hypothetical protein
MITTMGLSRSFPDPVPGRVILECRPSRLTSASDSHAPWGALARPTSTVYTASIIARGSINVMKSDNCATKLCCEGDLRPGNGVAVTFIVGSFNPENSTISRSNPQPTRGRTVRARLCAQCAASHAFEPPNSPVKNCALPRPNDQSSSVLPTILTMTSEGGMSHERWSSSQRFL